MKNFINKFKNHVERSKRTERVEEISILIGSPYEVFRNYYQSSKNTGIIVKTIEERETYTSKIRTAKINSPFEERINNNYNKIREKYDSESFGGMIIFNGEDVYNTQYLDVNDTDIIDSRINDKSNIKQMKNIMNSSLFKGYLDLKYLYEYARSLLKQKGNHFVVWEDKDLVFQKIISQKDVIDYLNKIYRISEDEEVFNVFVNKSDEWHSTFFKPLATIIDNIHLLENNNQDEKYKNAEENLKQIT